MVKWGEIGTLRFLKEGGFIVLRENARREEEEKIIEFTGVPHRLPDISDEELESLYTKIKPLVRCQGGVLCYIPTVDNLSHLRDYNFLRSYNSFARKAVGLWALEDITTYHSAGYMAEFQPTVAEVLSQIPKRWINGEVVGFEIIDHWLLELDQEDDDAMVKLRHGASVRLYGKK